MARTVPTRAERNRSILSTVVFILGMVAAWWFSTGVGAVVSGYGWQPVKVRPVEGGLVGWADNGWPVTLAGPDLDGPGGIACIVTAVLGAALVGYATFRIGMRRRDERTDDLAQWPHLRKHLSAHAVRKAARFTRPDLDWRARRRARLTDLGYHVGQLRGTRNDLWASFEIRVRIIARTGWGKTTRLLVKVARDLPGAALIGGTKADLFEGTVTARQAVGPVAVVDFSERDHRIAAGYPRVRWNPVIGCQDLAVARRRARAIVAGAEDGDRTDQQDGFFRDSATDVITAWLHAAALGSLDVRSILRWQQNIKLSDPRDILTAHQASEAQARLALIKHLDDRAERTTSSVERFILLALSPFATRDGEDFVVVPADESFDIERSIRDHGTVYVLADMQSAASVSPLLTLFADEWFHTARRVALSYRSRRLPVPAVGVVDELRHLIPIPSLPQVAAEMRSYGIGLVYSVQNAHQEVELYGPAAESLAQNVQLTIVGGYDRSIADELTDQAGRSRVAAPSVSGGMFEGGIHYSEGGERVDTVSARDQSLLADGDAIVRLLGSPLFYARLRSYRDDRKLRRTIEAEERAVSASTAAANASDKVRRDKVFSSAQAAYRAPSHVSEL